MDKVDFLEIYRTAHDQAITGTKGLEDVRAGTFESRNRIGKAPKKTRCKTIHTSVDCYFDGAF
jgi:hypothetical protein